MCGNHIFWLDYEVFLLLKKGARNKYKCIIMQNKMANIDYLILKCLSTIKKQMQLKTKTIY